MKSLNCPRIPLVGLSSLSRWVAAFAVAFICSGVFAQGKTSVLNIGNQDNYNLSKSFMHFEDTGASLGLSDIQQPAVQALFKSPGEDGAPTTNFGTTDAAVWLKLILRTTSTTPQHWLLEVANPPLDRIDLYVTRPDGTYDHQRGGDSLPFAERAIPHRDHVKRVDLVPDRETVVYMRIKSQGTVSAPTILWQPAALWQHDQETYAIFGLYFGLLIGLLAYNMLLYFSVRDRVYLVYVLFVASVGLSQLANSGLGAQFVWPELLWWNNVSIMVAYGASGTFGLLFARIFLSTRTKLPRLDILLRVLTGLWLTELFVALTLPYRAGVLMIAGLVAVGVVTLVLTGAISIFNRHPGAKYFGLAWAAFLLGIVVLIIHNYGMLPSNPITANAMLIGSAFEMVLLSFALADRINLARHEKELAQAQVTSEQALVLALQQSQERYRSVIEHVAEGMVVVQDERIVFVNTRATEILEATREEIITHGVAHRIRQEDWGVMTDRVHRRLTGQSLPERCQVQFENASKSMKWIEFGDNLVPWDGRLGLLIFFLDVTERHEAELETRRALDRQRELNELRSRFVAMTSHEFRTPLATILSAQDLLTTFSDRLSVEKKSELLEMIGAGVHRMTRMLERVLLLGQVDAQMLVFHPERLELRSLCAELIDEVRKQYPDSNCQIQLDISDELSEGVYDAKLLQHIFSNLLSNAVKYSPEGGDVCLRVFRKSEKLVFVVTDQGIGIPVDEIADLFESFQRASNVGTIPGTGLGLAIVKQSIELHGGTIDIQSNAGQGTTVTVEMCA
jgi:PAS domain S-box-containing protein